MAVLSNAERAGVRNGCVAKNGAFSQLLKADIDAAAQACEDFLESNAGAVSAAINAAISPKTLSAGGKKTLFAFVVLQKYLRDK